MSRVLSTSTAQAAVARMRAVINTGLVEQLNQLAVEGRRLSQPDVWDGVAAANFRANWEVTERALRASTQQLEQLRAQVERINANIMFAGGNQ